MAAVARGGHQAELQFQFSTYAMRSECEWIIHLTAIDKQPRLHPASSLFRPT